VAANVVTVGVQVGPRWGWFVDVWLSLVILVVDAGRGGRSRQNWWWGWLSSLAVLVVDTGHGGHGGRRQRWWWG